MMTEPHWLRMARQLQFGQRKKIVCCGSGPSMIINHSAKGYSGHCFRDKSHGGFHPHGVLSLTELAKRREASQELRTGPLVLPQGFTQDIPVWAKAWQLKAGIDTAQGQHYGFGFDPKSNRVIVPVYEDGVLVAFTARAVDKQTPKYIARYKEGYENAIFTSDPALMLPAAVLDGIPPYDLLVTEDVLSAIRVGRHVLSRSILGTTAKEKTARVLAGLRDNPTVGVWLDGDRAGRKGRDRVAVDLSLQGATIIKITTPLDPKRYSNREIKEILIARYSSA